MDLGQLKANHGAQAWFYRERLPPVGIDEWSLESAAWARTLGTTSISAHWLYSKMSHCQR